MMTPQNAIETLERYSSAFPKTDGGQEALDMAIEVLKKQIPQQVQFTFTRIGWVADVICPKCQNKVNELFCKTKNAFYCPKCGQVLYSKLYDREEQP